MFKSLTGVALAGVLAVGAVTASSQQAEAHWRGGGAVAAGVVGGLAAGAIIGGAIASQGAAEPLPQTQDPDFIAYCSRKYRSFDPIDGTFMARDGRRYLCQYP